MTDPDPRPDPRPGGDPAPEQGREDEGILQNEYEGEAGRDGIPANGTEPVAPRGPDDVGA